MNTSLPRRSRRRTLLLTFLLLFLLPAAASAALLAYEGGPRPWRSAYDRNATNLPPARSEPEARILVMAGRTRGWKGAVAMHSWVVIKPANASAWQRYDVVGWGGTPVRANWWGPDTWFGERPDVIVDLKGEQAAALIPRIEAAIKEYRYANDGDYRIWPGPNSNTFVATLLRAIPEAGVILPPNAIGRDFRPLPYAGLTDSRTGLELSMWGVLGVKVGWVEGVEINVGGFVAGLDIRRPGVKLPGFGRIGVDPGTATAAPQRS